MAAGAPAFSGAVVTGNACKNNSVLDIRCTVAGSKLRGNTYGNTPNFLTSIPFPVFANDAAAGSGGLLAGEEYRTATGELRVKL